MILLTIEIDFKHILFISTWVWDKFIEKYEMGSLQPISFCIPNATFWVVPKAKNKISTVAIMMCMLDLLDTTLHEYSVLYYAVLWLVFM